MVLQLKLSHLCLERTLQQSGQISLEEHLILATHPEILPQVRLFLVSKLKLNKQVPSLIRYQEAVVCLTQVVLLLILSLNLVPPKLFSLL